MLKFTKPTFFGGEIEKLERYWFEGDIHTPISQVTNYLCKNTNYPSAFFCNSCSDALEIVSLALGLCHEDEVIIPDYTFVTSASSFALRGANIKFCDVDQSDLCLDLEMAEKLISPNTKAIVWVDYAGCARRALQVRELCDKYGIYLIQDAAQSLGNWLYDGCEDTIVGDFVTYSFHYTKNITSGGEGGALLLKNNEFLDSVEVIFEKGTDRRAFMRKAVDKYVWRNLGSSFSGSGTQAAMLEVQLENLKNITDDRRRCWNKYHRALSLRAKDCGWQTPEKTNIANGHVFWMLAPNPDKLSEMVNFCRENNIEIVGHYQSLWNSPAGKKYGYAKFDLKNSTHATNRLLRLPIWYGISEEEIQTVVDTVNRFWEK